MFEDDLSGRSTRTEVIERGEPGYPGRLELLGDPPERIFVRGSIPDGTMVAIVGARDADPAGCRFAHRLARELVEAGVSVISGGATGIDSASHKGALEAGGRTVAVLGAGFDHPYPKSNVGLFGQLERSGALLSEFEPGVPPSRWTFPRRNRIVAALASAVIVVQASARSGALITAKEARKIGVPVGAVPASPADVRGRGCNSLIRGNAAMIEGVSDVANMLSGSGAVEQLRLPTMKSRGKETPSKALGSLSDEEAAVLERLSATPAHIDDIAALAELTAAQAASALMSLELEGLAEDLGGKVFVKV